MSIRSGSALKLALIPTFVVLVLSLYPQINIWISRGRDWSGAYAVTNYDEPAYSAYINGLISGKSRRSDPITGQEDLNYESLYSVQMVPAYAVAIPARVLGLSASSVFILLNILIPIFASLAIYMLIRDVTDDDLAASVGVLVVLCLGTLVVFQGEISRMVFDAAVVDFFPFLRRYQPGVAFPLFFVFCFFVWRSFTVEQNGVKYAIFSGLTLAVLVFSYFFLWTAAIAWLAMLTFLWVLFKRNEVRRVVPRVGVIAAFAVSALVPYSILLSNRNTNTDDTQLLVLTRAPDLFHISEIVGVVIVVAIGLLLFRRKIEIGSAVMMALSFALTPVILFNQQVITGRVLQPVHYEIFIANYLVLLSFVILVSTVAKTNEAHAPLFRKVMIYCGVAVAAWGFIESSGAARRGAAYENLRDNAMPALIHLRNEPERSTIISTNLMVADFIPTVTTHRPLWNPHVNSAGGLDHAQNLDLFYKYLYYSGFDENELAKAISENVFEVKAALFGGGRALSALDSNAKGVTRNEIDEAVQRYRDIRNNFDPSKAANPVITHIIVPAKAEPNYANLDRWYQRDEGKTFGLFKVYVLTPRTNSAIPQN
jgi:hypothetical protein